MSYATPEDYKTYFTDRNAVSVSAPWHSKEADDERLARHLRSASSRIDAYEDAISWLKLVASSKAGIGSNPENDGTVDASTPTVEFYSGGDDLWSRNRTGGGAY